MHSAVLLAEENRQLRTENMRQKKKKAKRRLYSATGGILTGQEGIERSQLGEIEPKEGVLAQPEQPRIRAPSRCSLCNSLEHTARRCPSKL